ncbi:MAG TPA: DNA polymerase III subunit gamma/tau [Pyrinomonadaceae bacterium]|nr:DNA polymerase III subunit gamma/tau [Pyrinomonadaceae bacterium]
MAYQVIARKWRPQSFDEVTGQEPITRTLRNAIEHQRLHHAYLFSGARGVGKTTTARLLAKALNCHKSPVPTATPCRTDDPTACPSCREITESRSIDVQEIDAASNTGVGNVRDSIIETVGFAPARDRYKVFIIDEVHMLSTPAFNALLKTIEEPPDRVVFIMATTEKQKVPETILSRCQQFEFRTIATAKVFERLKLIAKAENISVTDEALREIARSGEGSMRDAQSNFDQVISFAGTDIKKEDIELALGIAGADILIRVVNGIANNQPAEALAVVDDVVMRGHDLRNFCRDLLAHFRDLLVAKVSGSDELLEAAICDSAELKRQAALFSESDLVRFFNSLAETENLLRTASQPRYLVEIALVKLMEMRRLEPLSQLLDRVNALESVLRGGEPLATGTRASKVETNVAPATKSPTLAAATYASGAAAGAAPAMETRSAAVVGSSGRQEDTFAVGGPQTAVDQIKAALEQRRKMFLVTALEGASKAAIEGNELSVEFEPANRHLRDTLSKSDNVKILREVCREITGSDLGVRFVIADSQAAADAPPSKEELERRDQQALRSRAEKDPVIRQALKTFRGEIIDVKRIERE